MSQPYLSVVITGRNDDYGVNFLGRINTFIRHLDHHMAGTPDLIELIVVEWNPLDDRDPLYSVLRDAKNMRVRVITVGQELHAQFGAANPVLEFYGKNVGARRAQGEFVLTTNPDVLFSDSLINEIRQRWLKPDCLYRTDRYDFHSEGIEDIDSRDVINFALKNTFQAHTSSGSPRVDPPVAMMALPKSMLAHPHTNACGDFILAPRAAFFQANGLLENTQQKWHIDSYSLLRFINAGFRQIVLTAPACCFHMHHERKPADVAWNVEKALEMGRTIGSPDWGLGEVELPEWTNR